MNDGKIDDTVRNNPMPRGIGDCKDLIVPFEDEHERGEGLGIGLLLALVGAAALGAILTYMWVVSPIKIEHQRGIECLSVRPAVQLIRQ